ncbi:8126_t:CDS:2 [Ambispora gerdemannii]|uniref:8126_t:CDS:1 n=1 Tax=Ambispora gerdemannii TaxID=144530 RepID=A0A9N9CTP3_9GLOM|nr:8126_t:CDS:2 [Ambispora gerdemannii]
MSKIINKKLVIKEIEKIAVLTTSSSPSILSTNNLSESEILNVTKEIELFRENSMAKNKRKQSTECEKNLEQLLMTKDSVRKEVKSKKSPIKNFDDSINDQMGRTLTLSSVPATDILNENNHNLAAATYLDQQKA